jgi:succinate-semialdehyde dehydrogenase/glutarate-semialdehyde dehydrogenase
MPDASASLLAAPPPPRAAELIANLTRQADALGLSGDEREVTAPFTGRPIARVRDATPADVDRAFAQARQAQPAWAALAPDARAQTVLRFHDLVLAHRDDLIDLLQLEGGKARRHAADEVIDVANVARYYAHRAGRWLRAERRAGAVPLLTHVRVHHLPLGVVAVVAPWNYPLSMAITDALSALLAGNTVVLKPAEQTPLTALFACDLLARAGLPPGVVTLALGDGADIGSAMIDCADGLAFTGSTETGRIVARQAAERLIPASLELGGKNPLVVLDDAGLDRTIEGIVRGCFTNAGQLCIAAERLLIQRGICDQLVPRLVQRVQSMRVGGWDWASEMGVLASADQLAKVEGHVADARERGASVLCGGRRLPDVGPLAYAPTLLTDVPPDALLAREETFGPIIALYSFDTDADAIRMANDSDYGLNASVWSSDTRRALGVARQIRCGTVNVKEAWIAAWASVDAPMGGMGASGLGRRHGREGFFKYTEAQTIAVQRGVPLAPFGPISAERFFEGATLGMKALRRLGL